MASKQLFGNTLKAAARAAAATERARIYRMRAREMNGINARTRPIIENEARQGARLAYIQTYLANGYRECGQTVAVWYPEENVYMPEPCENLVSPGFYECPNHGNTYVNNDQGDGTPVRYYDGKVNA